MTVDSTVVSDVVIVVPGIMGSALADREGRPVWSVGTSGLVRAVRTLGRSLRRLELPPGIGDDHPDDGIVPTGLLGSLHVVPGLWSPVTGYDRLLEFLRSHRFHLIEPHPSEPGRIPNLLEFPYDWRLSNRYNGRRLAKVAAQALDQWRSQPGMEEAKLILVCHSMGGLVARWFVEQEGGAELTRALIAIGTPHRGAPSALKTLVNGIEAGIGPLRLSLTDFARSLPSLYQLLPQYNCLVTGEGRTDLISAGAPGLDATRLEDAARFHAAIAGEGELPYDLIKVVGIRQPTLTTARMARNQVMASNEIDGHNQGGDGTVPRLSAEPEAGRGKEVRETAGQHGELQASQYLFDQVDGIITRQEVIWQAGGAEPFGVEMADVFSTAEEVGLRVTDQNDRRLWVTLFDEQGETTGRRARVSPEGTADLGRFPEGGYRAVVKSPRPDGPSPISKPFLVLDPDVPLEE